MGAVGLKGGGGVWGPQRVGTRKECARRRRSQKGLAAHDPAFDKRAHPLGESCHNSFDSIMSLIKGAATPIKT